MPKVKISFSPLHRQAAQVKLFSNTVSLSLLLASVVPVEAYEGTEAMHNC